VVVTVDRLTVVDGMVDEIVLVYTVELPESAVVIVERLNVVDGIVELMVVV
jgi:hypothetical protein